MQIGRDSFARIFATVSSTGSSEAPLTTVLLSSYDSAGLLSYTSSLACVSILSNYYLLRFIHFWNRNCYREESDSSPRILMTTLMLRKKARAQQDLPVSRTVWNPTWRGRNNSGQQLILKLTNFLLILEVVDIEGGRLNSITWFQFDPLSQTSVLSLIILRGWWDGKVLGPPRGLMTEVLWLHTNTALFHHLKPTISSSPPPPLAFWTILVLESSPLLLSMFKNQWCKNEGKITSLYCICVCGGCASFC